MTDFPGALVRVRPALADDCSYLAGLIRRLAAFEDPQAVPAADEASLRRDGFGPHPRFTALVAERDGLAAGGVILLEGYSSWAAAPTLIVHDLFIEPEQRGAGIGRHLLAAAARVAVERGCCRVDVNVVGWNQPARDFYHSLGFAALADWLPYRLNRAGVEALAAGIGARG